MMVREEIISKVSSFPTLPTMAQKLLTMLQDPDVGSREISDIIQYDPALTANILKAANSAFLGYTNPVGSISEACFRIGTKWVLQIAMSSLIYSNINAPAKGYEITSEDLWRHSIAVAIMAENIGKLLNRGNNSLLYTAGLLHDIGKMVMESAVDTYYDEIKRQVSEDSLSFEEAEQSVLGIDHAEAGGMIAESWSFPQPIVDAIRWHHWPDLMPEDKSVEVADIVHVADALCLLQGFGVGRDDLNYKCSDLSMKRLSLTSQIVEKATSQLAASFVDIENMFKDTAVPSTVGR
jgi:putative nucleotidyltransferase with HDIG domain